MDRARNSGPSSAPRPAAPVYLSSHTGVTYGAPLSRDAPGYDFTFERVNLTRDALDSDAPTYIEKGIHSLRCIYYRAQQQARAVQPLHRGANTAAVPTTNKKYSLASTATRNAQVDRFGHGLSKEARYHLDDVYLEIKPDAERDPHIARALASPPVQTLYDRLTAAAIDIDSRRPEESDRGHTPPPQTAQEVKEHIAKGAMTFLTAFRQQLRTEAGISLLDDDDEGFGSRYSHGNASLDNLGAAQGENHPPHFSIHLPDIPILTRRPLGDEAIHVCWADIASFIEVRDSASEDLSTELTEQILQYVRSTKHGHPLCTTVHGVSICGHRLRLWTFGPGTFTTSPSYSLSNPEDRLPIARVLAFLVASKPSQLLGQWSPPRTFRIQPALGPSQFWSWVDGSPQVVFVRPEIFGSHTVIFGGRAENNDGTHNGPKSGDGWMSFIKCVILSRHLRGHELSMQQVLQHLHGTPLPLGIVETGDFCRPPSQKAGVHAEEECAFPLGPYCLGRDEEGAVLLHAFAYQHRLGERLPDHMPESELCLLTMQLGRELQLYSRDHAHYRDLNFGNWLFERTAEGVRLVLVDHGNMRLGMQKRADGEREHELGGTRRTATLLKQLAEIALDDARSVTRAFRPSGAEHVEGALVALRERESSKTRSAARAQHSNNAVAGTPDRGEQGASIDMYGLDDSFDLDELKVTVVETFEVESDPPALVLRLYAHTYIDDLESILYMLLVMGARRSFSGSDKRLDDLTMILQSSSRKRLYWGDPELWKDLVNYYCPSMSVEWLQILIELRAVVIAAQRLRRKRLRALLGTEAETLEPQMEEHSLTTSGTQCFTSFLAVLNKYRTALRTQEFIEKDFQPEESPGDTSIDAAVLDRLWGASE